MCQLLETIKVSRNSLQHLAYHTNRVSHSRYLLWGKTDQWDLSAMIEASDLNPEIVYRCRFIYGSVPEKTEFIPYLRREIRKLYVVECGMLDYSLKYADRRNLEALRTGIPDPDLSDILMVRNGFLTDTSFANIVLSDGTGWYTPSVPLLRGTKREFYLDKGLITERDIRISDLHLYKTVRLINAMIDLEESNDIPVDQIITDAHIPG